MMTRDVQHRVKNLPPEVRRQISSEPMRKYVRSFPAFAVKPDVPAHMRDLLDELDRAEKKSKVRDRHINGRS